VNRGGAQGRRLCAAFVGVLVVILAPSAAVADDARFVPGEVLVRFETGAGPAARATAFGAVDAGARERLSLRGAWRVELDGTGVHKAVAELEDEPDVRYAEPNFIYRPLAAPNDPSFGLQWALNNTGQPVNGTFGAADADIDAVQAWDRGIGSGSVQVAIVDLGVAYTHPDLLPNIAIGGRDFHDDDNDPAPGSSDHGTAVAGVAGAQGNNARGISGVSREVGLLPLRVGDTNLDVADVAEAFDYARTRGAKVVNLSAGGPNASQTALDAINAAPNTLFVFAAGNDGANNDNPATPQYPCNYNRPNVVCVAATNQRDARASFSNVGPSTVDLAAPGVNLLTTRGPASYAFANGTSMAAPVAAGAAAVYMARNPIATAAQTRNALRATVDKLPSLDNRVETAGRLNLARALGIANPDPEPPPETTITKAPKKKDKSRKKKKKAKFEFISSKPGSTFTCFLDEEAGKPCASPYRRKVKRGRHDFRVSATDQAGNTDPTPAIHSWKLKKKKKKGRR